MSWTAPRTWVTAEVVTAGNMNTHVRDNLLETAAAKATGAGEVFYATAATAIAALAAGSGYAGLRLNAGATAPEWDGLRRHHIIKSADETVTNSTTLQDDDDLVLAVGANEIWLVRGFFIVDAPTAGDFKVGWTAPASPTVLRLGFFGEATSGVSHVGYTSTVAINAEWDSIPMINGYHSVYLENGSNAGNLQLQWAQVVADATGAIVKKGSWLECIQIA